MTSSQRPPEGNLEREVLETPDVAPPELPPEYAHLDGEDLQAALAAQAERLAQPSGNVDIHGAPHFLRNMDGAEVCGNDGQPWPCDTAKGMRAEEMMVQGIVPDTQQLPTMAEAARAAGMDLTEFEARLRDTRGL